MTAHGRDKGWRSAGEQRRPAGAHSRATGDGSITVRVRLSGPDALSLPPPLQLQHYEMCRHWEGVSEAKAFSATRSGRQLSPDAAQQMISASALNSAFWPLNEEKPAEGRLIEEGRRRPLLPFAVLTLPGIDRSASRCHWP